VDEKIYARTVALTAPLRAPSFAPAHRSAQDAARISSRGLLSTAWCSGVIRAPLNLDSCRWFLWGKPPDRGDTTPRHEPGTGREQSRNTPLGG